VGQKFGFYEFCDPVFCDFTAATLKP